MTPRKPTRAKQLGVSDAEYARLLAAQGGHCALCPNTPKTRRLHVDHDHATGKVRGLLCYVCNKYLPASRDAAWHRAAADYLEPHMSAGEAVAVMGRLLSSGLLKKESGRGSLAQWRDAIEKANQGYPT